MILDLDTLKDGQVFSDVIVYVGTYKKQAKKTDGFYGVGSFVKQNTNISFKVWDTSLVNSLDTFQVAGEIVKISGSVGVYNGVLDIKVTSLALVPEGTVSKVSFLKTLDVQGIYNAFCEFINKQFTPAGGQLLNTILVGEDIFGRFTEEFAGASMHDAAVGGLMNHTYKMLKYAECLISLEPRSTRIPNFADLLYLGVALHDIGKVKEMKLGVYQPNSFVTHRTIGIEILSKYKANIVDTYDENFYYNLLAIIQGHHGEFGDKPTTVTTYIVHLIDMLESQTTGIFDKLENNNISSFAGHNTVYTAGTNLTVY